MKRITPVLICAGLLLSAGCDKKPKEVSKAVKAEAEMLISEAQFASSIREFPRAQELVERAIKLRDDVPEYWVTLGMSLRKQDNLTGARKAYETALDLHKARYKAEKNPEELGQQAFVLALLGRTDEALKVLEKGLKSHPDSAVLKKMADPRGLPATFKNEKFKELAL
jgi:tetratricopeptide (TPR) repeat protein